MADFTPVGAADQNSDAVRQAGAAAWFNSVEGLLAGIDDSLRVQPSSGNVLGYSSSYGVDIGVGNNGEFYARGRTGQIGNDAATAAPSPAVAGLRITPGLVLLAIGAFLLLRK